VSAGLQLSLSLLLLGGLSSAAFRWQVRLIQGGKA